MNEDVINEIRNRSDIVDVISSYIPLSKRGRNYFGVCPFHADTNPSMSVSPEKQIYKCFACGASGNVYSFVMDYEKISFPEALKLLGDKVGITVQNSFKKREEKHDKYFKLYEFATAFYENNLASEEGKAAKKYLSDRKISEKSINNFNIGLSLRGSNLTKILLSKDYNEIELETYGLSSDKNDKYQDRIMFPLKDAMGRICGFSGRIYEKSDTAKYINTMETPIFKKGETLFNYQEAKRAARTEGGIFILEGFMDVIRLYEEGLENAVALMGTAMTKEQEMLIRKASDNIYLCLDGDDAGLKAALEIAKNFEDKNLKIVYLPGGADPDTYIVENGIDSFRTLVKNAYSYYDFKLIYYKTKMDLTSEVELSKYIDLMLKDIALIKDEIKKEIALKKLAKLSKIEYNTLEKRLGKEEQVSKTKKVVSTDKKVIYQDKYLKAEIYLIKLLMSHEDLIQFVDAELFINEEISKLATEIIKFYNENAFINEADFYTSILNNEECLNIYKKLSVSEELEYSDKLVKDLVGTIKDKKKSIKIDELSNKIKKEIDPLTKAKLADEMRKLRIGDINDKRT